MSLGMGVMINMLSGDDGTSKAVQTAIGRTITSTGIAQASNGESQLWLEFEDGSKLVLRDRGQSCCESRYMTLDGDSLDYYKGATFIGAELGDASEEGHDMVHEIQFLNIKTSKGVFTVSNHNEHNGYYGGFSISAYFEEP